MKGGLIGSSSPPSKGKTVDAIRADSSGFSFAFVKSFAIPLGSAAAVSAPLDKAA